jgi:CHAT domain-containing protein
MDFPLEEWVTNFREGVTSYHTTTAAPASLVSKMTTQYVQNATQLYDKLIKPVAPYLNEDIFIVPDGVLGYLPFEILLKDKPEKLSNFHTYPYFLKDHSLSYCYSATLLDQMINRKHIKEPTKSSLAIAPFYEGDTRELISRVDTMQLIALRSDTLQALQFSGKEAAIVAKMTQGDQLIGKAATLTSFKDRASEYKMLHLSTHGIANDKIGDYAYLAFGDNENTTEQYEKLYIRDIYNLSLNADMVVLSACNTAYGKLQKGEGVISMARAFAYSGAKSIITTHWSVDDASTGVLMEDFYRQLIQYSSTKDEALRAAKMNFIKNNKGLKAHPYFWAAFVAIGDMRPIQN